jgi:hypothetical protein
MSEYPKNQPEPIDYIDQVTVYYRACAQQGDLILADILEQTVPDVQ